MATKKHHWTTEEIVEFVKKYYGVRLTWLQKLELWLFGIINRNKKYYLFDKWIFGE